MLEKLMAQQVEVPSFLAEGAKEVADLADPSVLNVFFEHLFCSRVGLRFLVDHQARLGQDFPGTSLPEHQVGAFSTRIMPSQILAHCAATVRNVALNSVFRRAPDIEIVGHTQVSLSYTPFHVEYMCETFFYFSTNTCVMWINPSSFPILVSWSS